MDFRKIYDANKPLIQKVTDALERWRVILVDDYEAIEDWSERKDNPQIAAVYDKIIDEMYDLRKELLKQQTKD